MNFAKKVPVLLALGLLLGGGTALAGKKSSQEVRVRKGRSLVQAWGSVSVVRNSKDQKQFINCQEAVEADPNKPSVTNRYAVCNAMDKTGSMVRCETKNRAQIALIRTIDKHSSIYFSAVKPRSGGGWTCNSIKITRGSNAY